MSFRREGLKSQVENQSRDNQETSLKSLNIIFYTKTRNGKNL